MDAIAGALLDAFVAAYRPYVEGRLRERGLPAVADAVDEGERWLEEGLGEVLGAPFAEQSRAPLEVFQESLRPVTEALTALGIEPAQRDPATESALPGDRYDLAPASSQPLGDEALAAHLAWGAAKAAAFRPSAVLVSRNLLDVGRIAGAVESSGYRLDVVGDVPEGDARWVVGFVDLEHPSADEAVRSLAPRCHRVVAFGPHVDDHAMTRARALGASDAVARSRFFSAVGGWLPPVT